MQKSPVQKIAARQFTCLLYPYLFSKYGIPGCLILQQQAAKQTNGRHAVVQDLVVEMLQ
jgi:hypothetical protein